MVIVVKDDAVLWEISPAIYTVTGVMYVTIWDILESSFMTHEVL